MTIEEALATILDHVKPLEGEQVSYRAALDHVLAEAIRASDDSPPFDKSLMDGYALDALSVESAGDIELTVVGCIAAGAATLPTIKPGETVRIMTGAPLPPGTDGVIPLEFAAEQATSGRVRLGRPAGFRPGSAVLARGREWRAGDTILSPGQRLTAPVLGLLAALGRTEVTVVRRPRLAIVTTGDELVEPNVTPGPGQIRNSNASTLLAMATADGLPVPYTAHGGDDPAAIGAALYAGLTVADVLLVTGGVSKGDFDHLPRVLVERGVTPVFHQVDIKPGRPLWFGVRGLQLVFGMPGNPVSVLVGYHLFVTTALRALQGVSPSRPTHWRLPLASDWSYRTDRVTYFPAKRTTLSDGAPAVQATQWFGSPDLRSASLADAFIVCPVGDHRWSAGTVIDVLPMSSSLA